MSENIQVTVSPERVVLQPGGKAEVVATLQNAGDVVEVFSIELGGVEHEWYSLSLSSVSLFPGDKESIKITLNPPPSTVSKAGSYNVFNATATSGDFTCSFTLDPSPGWLPDSWRATYAGSWEYGHCSTNAARTVTAGTYTLSFTGSGITLNGLSPQEATFHAVVIPNS